MEIGFESKFRAFGLIHWVLRRFFVSAVCRNKTTKRKDNSKLKHNRPTVESGWHSQPPSARWRFTLLDQNPRCDAVVEQWSNDLSELLSLTLIKRRLMLLTRTWNGVNVIFWSQKNSALLFVIYSLFDKSRSRIRCFEGRVNSVGISIKKRLWTRLTVTVPEFVSSANQGFRYKQLSWNAKAWVCVSQEVSWLRLP